MDAMSTELEQDRRLREELRAALNALPSASDRKHASGLAAWYGAFTPKQRGFARVLLERAKRSAAQGGLAKVGDIWDSEAGKEALAAPVSPPPANAVVTGKDLEEALAKAVEPAMEKIAGQVSAQQRDFEKSAASVIAQQVLAAALRELEARKPREVKVTCEREGLTREVRGKPHPKFEHLLRAASLRLANGYAPGILLAGEASSGKTHGAKMLAEALGLSWHFNGAISFPHEMLGFIDAGGAYHRTPFREAYEFGGVYTFDEVDRSDPVALLAVNPHLAGDCATFPDRQVPRHADCILIATANTWGHGADGNYSGATKLDGAFLSRFPVRLSWDIDLQLEESLVGAGDWLKRLRADREKARQAGLKVLIDTRAGLAGAGLVRAGYSVQEAAEMTYLAALKPDQRKLLT
jgi:hypothetical protein